MGIDLPMVIVGFNYSLISEIMKNTCLFVVRGFWLIAGCWW